MAKREPTTTLQIMAKRDALLKLTHETLQEGGRLPQDLWNYYWRILNDRPYFDVSDKSTPLQFLNEYERLLTAHISRKKSRRSSRGKP